MAIFFSRSFLTGRGRGTRFRQESCLPALIGTMGKAAVNTSRSRPPTSNIQPFPVSRSACRHHNCSEEFPRRGYLFVGNGIRREKIPRQGGPVKHRGPTYWKAGVLSFTGSTYGACFPLFFRLLQTGSRYAAWFCPSYLPPGSPLLERAVWNQRQKTSNHHLLPNTVSVVTYRHRRDVLNLQPRFHKLQIHNVKELLDKHSCLSRTKVLNNVQLKK